MESIFETCDVKKGNWCALHELPNLLGNCQFQKLSNPIGLRTLLISQEQFSIVFFILFYLFFYYSTKLETKAGNLTNRLLPIVGAWKF